MEQIEEWMKKGLAEVKANGYVYPCEVLYKSGFKDGNEYVIRVLLPTGATSVVSVPKSSLMSRAHYNLTFDPDKSTEQLKKEHLYPIGSWVKFIGQAGEKYHGKVLSYSDISESYVIEAEIKSGNVVKFHLPENQLKLSKKRNAEVRDSYTAPKFKINQLVRVLEGSWANDTGNVTGFVRQRDTDGKNTYAYRLSSLEVPPNTYILEKNLENYVQKATPKFSVGEKVLWTNKGGRKREVTILKSDYDSYTGKTVYTVDAEFTFQGVSLGVSGVGGISEDQLSKIDPVPDVPVVSEEKTEEKFKPGDRVIFKPKSTSNGRLGTVVKKNLQASYGNSIMWDIKQDNYSEVSTHEESFFELYTPEIDEKINGLPFVQGDEVIINTNDPDHFLNGQRATIVHLSTVIKSLKGTGRTWVVLPKSSDKYRLVEESELRLYTPEEKKEKDEKVEEPKSKNIYDEVIDEAKVLFNDVLKNRFDSNPDFKEFVTRIQGVTKIAEYFTAMAPKKNSNEKSDKA